MSISVPSEDCQPSLKVELHMHCYTCHMNRKERVVENQPTILHTCVQFCAGIEQVQKTSYVLALSASQSLHTFSSFGASVTGSLKIINDVPAHIFGLLKVDCMPSIFYHD
jgi:hypothetical protein